MYIEAGKEHTGIIAVPRQRYSVGEQVKGLQKLSASFDSEQIKNQLLFLGTYI